MKKLRSGLYYRPERSRFGEVPPSSDALLRAFFGRAPYVVTGSARWNELGLEATALLTAPLVYNTTRTGRLRLGGKEFLLRRVRFPRKPTKEWFAVDLLENRGLAGAALEVLEAGLVRALRSGRLDAARLEEMAEGYGTRESSRTPWTPSAPIATRSTEASRRPPPSTSRPSPGYATPSRPSSSTKTSPSLVASAPSFPSCGWCGARRARLSLWSSYVVLRDSHLFSPDDYTARYPDVREAGVDPVLYYLLHGAMKGHSPGPDIDGARYLRENPDVERAGLNPLVHFFLLGAREGRKVAALREHQGSEQRRAGAGAGSREEDG